MSLDPTDGFPCLYFFSGQASSWERGWDEGVCALWGGLVEGSGVRGDSMWPPSSALKAVCSGWTRGWMVSSGT